MKSIEDARYSQPFNKPEIKNSIFIWLDILGYSAIVEDERKYIELSRLLKKFQELFNESDDYDSTIISDGIILRLKDASFTDLKEIIHDIGKKQFQFIKENRYFIRGGIAVGSKIEDTDDPNSAFVSNGLARAVYIESSQID